MKKRGTGRARDGFTLVELLVAMAVGLIMLVALVELMSSAIAATNGGNRHMDADTEARWVLDRIGSDIARMTKRSDVDYYFAKNNPGSDQMVFYSESSGYYPSGVSSGSTGGTVSLVGYRINASNQMERLSKGLAWNGVAGLPSGASPMVYLPATILGTWPAITATGASTDSDNQVVGDQVFRMELCYLVQNSTVSATLSDTPYLAPNTTYAGLEDVQAIVVTIAVLDPKSQLLVSGAALAAAGQQLPHVTGTASATNPNPIPTAPAALWQAQIAANGLGLPKAAAGQVRVYQRYYYLNHTQTL